MSLTGNGSLSIRKKDVKEQKSLALGFKKLQFAHQAGAGDTVIDLTSLIVPPDMSSAGFTNPNASDIASANLFTFRKNLKLISSLRGELIDFLSYQVNTSTKISLNFEAEEDEIFVGIFDPKPVTSTLVADARSLVATGTLAVGVTDFPVGQPFTINKNPNAQVGDVLVFRNGIMQARNTGNGTTGGNYQEVPNGTGLSNLIRFNTAPSGQDDSILVVGNGLVAERPTGSTLAAVEQVAGVVDKLVPTVSALSGQPESNFQDAPSSVDLKQFGDRVVALENNKQDSFTIPHQTKILSSDHTTASVISDLTFNNLEIGKTYRISGQIFHFQPASSDIDAIVFFNNGATEVGKSRINPPASTSNRSHTDHPCVVFTATDTILEFEFNNATTEIQGNGTRGETFITLEELPNHVATTQWT